MSQGPALPAYLCPMRIILALFLVPFLTGVGDAQCISGDCRNGRGIFVYPSGAKYIGDFKDGEIHGIGVCYYTDGSKYQGEWQNRYPHGKGTKTYADGYRHTGLWYKGKPVDEEGRLLEEYVVKGKEEKNDGTDIQSGCLAGDCRDGQGTFAYPDGSRYDGQFVEGRLEGLGTWYFTNGDRYVGAFRSNFPHGKGTLYTAEGTVTIGEWREGEYVGASEARPERLGCVAGDCQDGHGTYIFREATATYTGTFREGKPHGAGVIRYANGNRYEGDWEHGLFHGIGTLFQRDGTEVKGLWRNGQYQAPSDLEEALLATRRLEDDRAPATGKRIFAAPRKVWAVIVGVGSYTHMPALRYTDDDAYRFYAFLKSVEGGGLRDEQIRILIDEEATRQRVLETVEDLFGKAGEEDLVLFYFSGHGVRGAFLPIDFDGYNNKILYEEISERIERSAARYRICFADACHSGGLFTDRSVEPQEELLRFYQPLFEASTGTAIIMSSKSEETSLESAGLRQGVFSHFMMRGLKGEADADGDGMVTIQELYDYIYVHVRAYTGMRQSPVIRGDFDPDMPVSVVR
jgi:hypothetical protein